MTCTLCPLHENAETVFLTGEGPSPCDVLFVSDHPSAEDDADGTVLSGDEGSLLRAAVRDWTDIAVHYTHVVRCHPGHAKPSVVERKTCTAAHLAPEIERLSPRLVVAMGATAFHTLTGQTGVLKHAGKTFTSEWTTVPVLALAHPSYVIRDDGYMQRWLQHVWSIPAMIRAGNTGDYRLLTDRVDVRRTLAAWALKECAFDYETTGLNPRAGKVISVAVSPEAGQAVAFDPNKCAMEWKSFLRAKGRRIVHNLSFEYGWTLVHFGMHLSDVWDTKLFAMLQDENAASNLKSLALEMTDIGNYAHGIAEEIGGDAWAKKTLEEVWRYNAADADATRRIYGRQIDLLSNA